MFPQDVDTEIRRGCYAICLQLARFLLCGQSSENSFTAPPSPPHREPATVAASPVAMSTGTVDSDLNDSLNNSAIEAKRPRSSSMIDDVHPSVRVAIEVCTFSTCSRQTLNPREKARCISICVQVASFCRISGLQNRVAAYLRDH